MKVTIISYSEKDWRVAIRTRGIIIELPCIDADSARCLRDSIENNISMEE